MIFEFFVYCGLGFFAEILGLSLAGFFNDMYPSETTRLLLVGKGSLYMRLTVSEENMTLKKPSTHRGTMPESNNLPGKLSGSIDPISVIVPRHRQDIFRHVSLGNSQARPRAL